MEDSMEQVVGVIQCQNNAVKDQKSVHLGLASCRRHRPPPGFGKLLDCSIYQAWIKSIEPWLSF